MLFLADDPTAGSPPVRATAGRYAQSIEIQVEVRNDANGRIYVPLVVVNYDTMSSDNYDDNSEKTVRNFPNFLWKELKEWKDNLFIVFLSGGV